MLPINAGVCAFDRDECTVTIALDSEGDVDAMVAAIPSRHRKQFAPLYAEIARRNAERGRPLTAREKLENLAAWLAENEDEDGLDPIEALVADAAAAEPSRMVHEGGEYYAERIIRRAMAQGTLALASCDTHPKDGDVEQAPLVSGAVTNEVRQTPKHDPSNP